MKWRGSRSAATTWLAQLGLAVGVVLSFVAGMATGARDLSFVAVMALALATASAVWARSGFGPALIVVDLWYALMGFAISAADDGTTGGTALVRDVVEVLWVAGGLGGALAAWRASRPLRGDATDTIDTEVHY